MKKYTYKIIGIMADGSDDIIDISASCQTEAEIIIESFHDGGYELLSEPDEADDYDEYILSISNK